MLVGSSLVLTGNQRGTHKREVWLLPRGPHLPFFLAPPGPCMEKEVWASILEDDYYYLNGLTKKHLV